MATAQLVSVEEYLHSSFEVDAEYVEGSIVPRAMPQKDHSKVQTRLIGLFLALTPASGLEVWTEQRIRTKVDPAHYRIPDVCLTRGEPDEQIFTNPPFLCVEILSPEDSAVDLRIKVYEYLAFGVEWVWVIDPVTRSGEIYSPTITTRVTDGVFRASEITADLSKI